MPFYPQPRIGDYRIRKEGGMELRQKMDLLAFLEVALQIFVRGEWRLLEQLYAPVGLTLQSEKKGHRPFDLATGDMSLCKN